MVKKKRLSNPPSTVDTCPQNGMILEGVSHSKESLKKCYANVSEINLCQNTRSKQKQPLDEFNGEEKLEVEELRGTRTRTSRGPPAARTTTTTAHVTQPPRKTESSRCTGISDQVKTRRSWELWSVDDKNTFFEALSEYGKDFESIQHYICQKNKKKNHPPHMIKNKDQVRHFYYRTWHKISKYLDIGDDVKKQTQELYGLINYGELRKKIGGRLDEKSSQKLNELILKGATTVRLKGKNLRVKTPVCRALKKLIHIDDPKEEHLKFPHMITLEFQPQTNAAWTHVQSIAHNPRLRMTVSLQRRLSTVLNFLQTRWKSHRLKQKQNVSSSEVVLRQEYEKVLRVLPKKDATITLISMQTSSENLTNMHVCLQNYRENVLQKNLVADSAADCRKVQSKQLSIKVDSKNLNEKLVPGDCGTAEENCVGETVVSDHESEKLKGNGESETDAPDDITLGKNTSEHEKPASDINSMEIFHGNEICENKNSEEKLQTIRRGWNCREAGALTVGEIYVMLGNPNKIILEYCWENDVNSKSLDNSTAKSPAFQTHSLVLNKLMHAATTSLSDLSKMKQEKQFSSIGGNVCHCGHVCSPVIPAFKLPLLAGPPTTVFRNGSKMQKNLISKLVNKDVSATEATSDSAVNKGQHEGVQAAQFKNYFPSLPQKKLTTSEAAFKEQLDRFLPANKKARGNIRKSVVVQRELPLLPKTLPSHSMMTLRIVPTASQLAGSFVPVISKPNLSPSMSTYSKIVKLPPTKVPVPTTIVKTGEKITTIITSMAVTSQVTSSPSLSSLSSVMEQNTVTVKAMNLQTENQSLPSKCGEHSKEESFLRSEEAKSSTATRKIAEPESQVNVSSPPSSLRTSPPNISSLFDISMPGSETQEGFQMENTSVSLGNSTKLLDISLNNSNSTFLDVPTTASGLSNSSLYKGTSALENVWLNGENEDLSLSSLLGNLESPMKHSSSGISISTFQEGGGTTSDSVARLSTDVDNHFHTMLNESSLDYISKFADLAAQIAETSLTSGK